MTEGKSQFNSNKSAITSQNNTKIPLNRNCSTPFRKGVLGV
jgi:hypothetical protein